MRLRRLFGAAVAAALIMSGTAFGANGPAGDPYVFSEEVGPGVSGSVIVAPQPAAQLPADQQSLADILAEAADKANSLSTYEADYDLYMAISMNGLRLLNIGGDGTMAYDATDLTNPKVRMDMNMTMDDGTDVMSQSRMDIYLADGYYYMDMDGTKQKAAFPMSELLTQQTAQGNSVAQSVGMFRDLSMTEADGIRTISYNYDTAQLNALVDQALELAMADTNAQLSTLLPGYTFDFSVKGCEGSMRLGADGTLLGEDVSMIMDYVIAGEGESLDIELAMIMHYDFTSLGQPVSMPVINPADYTEIPSGGATLVQ